MFEEVFMNQFDLERFIFPYTFGVGVVTAYIMKLYVLQPGAFWQMKCIRASTLH